MTGREPTACNHYGVCWQAGCPGNVGREATAHEHEWVGGPGYLWCVECHRPHPDNVGREASTWQYPPKDGIEGCYAAGFDRCQDVQTIERMDGSWEVRCFACGAFYGMGMTPPARESTPDDQRP